MEAINNISIHSLLDTSISLMTAFILGSMIGLERQYHQRTAGLRTNVLVAVGAAVFVDMANRLSGREGAVHVAAMVVSGVGFLGAGVIMKGDGGGIRGLNTAATLWGRRRSAPVREPISCRKLFLPLCSCWPGIPCFVRW